MSKVGVGNGLGAVCVDSKRCLDQESPVERMLGRRLRSVPPVSSLAGWIRAANRLAILLDSICQPLDACIYISTSAHGIPLMPVQAVTHDQSVQRHSSLERPHIHSSVCLSHSGSIDRALMSRCTQAALPHISGPHRPN